MNKVALILAAGQGTRFNVDGFNKPKGFIEIHGEPLIKRSLDNLIEAGYTNIFIVVGHQKEYYISLIEDYPQISIVDNYEYATSGSAYSLYLGLMAIADNLESVDVTVLESDLLYHPDILKRGDELKSEVKICGPTNSGDEVYVSVNDSMKICGLSKTNKTEMEFVGITHLAKTDVTDILHSMLVETIFKLLAIEYEDVLVDHNLNAVHTDAPWCEIDNTSHYYRAINQILPKL